jgi:hypothetical protein
VKSRIYNDLYIIYIYYIYNCIYIYIYHIYNLVCVFKVEMFFLGCVFFGESLLHLKKSRDSHDALL